jgi:hypothetical protein
MTVIDGEGTEISVPFSSPPLSEPSMKTFEELLNTQEPGWAVVQEWLRKATNPVEVLAPVEANRKPALVTTQVTTRSPMGAIVYETGGILVDYGWLRILGSGCERLPRSMPEWNRGRSIAEYGESAPYWLVADDVIGGLFALAGATGSISYFAPDTLRWEPMGMGYSQFIYWCFTGDTAKYYADYRWSGWQEDVKDLPGDRVFNFYPFLWAKAESLESRSRKQVPIAELCDLQLDIITQLCGQQVKADGAQKNQK